MEIIQGYIGFRDRGFEGPPGLGMFERFSLLGISSLGFVELELRM